DDREKAFRKQHEMEEKLSFDVEARLSKLYGLWAAEKLGIVAEEDAKTYAMSVVEANLDEPGFDDILRKVRADFEEKGVDISDEEMSKVLDKTLAEAKVQIEQEKENG
ncbi:MAG: DUF1476 domain-containing protein, partial [Pseudomonadota bacterium]